jgi:hypothetical protein
MSNNLLIFILITILFLDLYDQLTYDKNINIKPIMSSIEPESGIDINNIKLKQNNNKYSNKADLYKIDVNSNINNTKFNEEYDQFQNTIENIREQMNNTNNKFYNQEQETETEYEQEEVESFTESESEFKLKTNKFGKPYDYKPNEYIIWQFDNPSPWTKIVYKYGHSDPYNFYIKVKIPSLNDFENWKNIVTNLYFNPTTGELVIPTKDEETALALANLMVTNFNGDLSLQEIINRDLIAISITKAIKYVVVRNKIREQIITGINYKNNKSNNSNNSNKEFSADLVNKNKQEDDTSNYFYYNNNNNKTDTGFEAYEGSEFSFI